MEEIDPRHLLVEVVGILKRLNIPYVITGGMAVLIWGRPRFTADIDIVVELKYEDLDKLEKSLRQLSDAGYIDKTTMEKAVEKHGEFNFIDGNTGVKVDFWVLKNNEFDKSCLKRGVAKEILGEKVYFISPEDLILTKLEWYQKSESSQQLEDVESVLKISGKKLDKKYLTKWAKKLGVSKILNQELKCIMIEK